MELAEALPQVDGDRIELQQVLVNLMNNAVEATQLVTDRQRELVIRTHQDQVHQVLVAVRDCGVGIATENGRAVQALFYHQIQRNGHGTRDLPLHYRSARWTIIGLR